MNRLLTFAHSLQQLARSERTALVQATAAHLDLVLEALVIAVLIAVPLGVLASRSRWVEWLAVGMANQLQTIPGLALLGFLLIAFGTIGKPPALAALVVYALLPILKNTVLGLRSVDRGVLEAARGMGMTAIQRLRLVELPLAVPAVLGGVRIAAVSAVGLATLAAAIGARGLGTYIYRGISLSDPRLVLLGAVPAALLALLVDGTLGEVERWLDPTRKRPPRWRGALAGAVLAGLAIVAGWGFTQSLGGRGTVVHVGSKDSTEPILLGHMMGDLIEAETGLPVDRSRLNLAGTLVCYNALKAGEIDVYVEYTGTALTTILNQPPLRDPDATLAEVSDGVRRDGVTMLEVLGFENTFAMLMRAEQARALGVRSISDLRRVQNQIRAGFGPEFMNRPDGYPGLVRAYGLTFSEPPREMDRSLLYQAVAQGALDLAAGDSTDGRIDALNLVVLDDDRQYFPHYQAVPLANTATLRRHPGLESAINRLARKIDAPTMRRLNRRVDLEKADPREVARDFLLEQGLLREGP
jgi:osmoprotectant transport system permease protein